MTIYDTVTHRGSAAFEKLVFIVKPVLIFSETFRVIACSNN